MSTLMVTARHKQRFWPPACILVADLKDKPAPPNEYLDVPIGTEVNATEYEGGRYLCEKDGYYCLIGASWVNTVCPGVVCKCPTGWCPRHGRLKG